MVQSKRAWRRRRVKGIRMQSLVIMQPSTYRLRGNMDPTSLTRSFQK
jgi:hypothetical protein